MICLSFQEDKKQVCQLTMEGTGPDQLNDPEWII